MITLGMAEIKRDLLRGFIALNVMFPVMAFAMDTEAVTSVVQILLS